MASFKNKNIIREFPFFTHFACLPFIDHQHRAYVECLQTLIEDNMANNGFNIQENLKRHSHLLSHVTMFKMTLNREQAKQKLKQILQKQKQVIREKISQLQIVPGEIKYFTRFNKNEKSNELTVIYLQIDEKSANILSEFADYLLRILLNHEIIVNEELKDMNVKYDHKQGKFRPQTFHISLFRCRNLMEKQQFKQVYQKINNLKIKLSVDNLLPKCFDISTMKAYGQDQFYLPLERVFLHDHQQKVPIVQKKTLQQEQEQC